MRTIEKTAIAIFSPLKPDSHVSADYDRPADVLYISFLNSPPEEADFGRGYGDYIIRFKNDGSVVGVTVINAMEHYEKGFADKPTILREPVLIHFA